MRGQESEQESGHESFSFGFLEKKNTLEYAAYKLSLISPCQVVGQGVTDLN